jgi:vacuolar protein sorting-associated protein 41
MCFFSHSSSDPILPASLYERALEKMLMDAENLAQMAKENVTVASNVEVEGTKQFLESLVAWGPTKILKEYIKLYKYSRDQRRGDKAIIEDLKGVEVALQRRYMQTAAVYLQLPARDSAFGYEGSSPRYDNGKDETQDSLFGVSKVLAIIAPRVPLALSPDDTSNSDSPTVTPLPHILPPNNQTSLEAMARLRMMEGRTDLALKCLLAIGACHSTESLESFETKATDIVNGGHSMEDEPPVRIGTFCYDYIMVLIESQHLNQCLLQDDFVLSTDSKLFKPLIALLRLVGLQRLGNFLIEHCVSPDFSYNMTLSEASPGAKHNYHQSHEVLRREPLPLDQVAKQLESSPALLHWYLHLVFTRRPEFYIKFPNNAVPPKAVTALHRQHFQLYIDFAGELRDSTKALASTQQYNAESLSTPLLSFLKASLPLGGILPVDARRALEIERTKNAENEQDDDELELSDTMKTASPHFALELAYIIENFSDSTEKTALGVLNLYLLGCKSLVLAVLFAQRQKQYSSLLWDRLISYCTGKTSDGILFGELLESAAYSGADLARLVERIPPGMVVEGLRPRLVAAVADYRMKLEIYTAATAAGSEEAIVLMREITHRSRRGVRYSFGENQVKSYAELILEKNNEDQGVIGEKITEELPTALSKECKIKPRQVHNRLAYSISRR